MIFLISIASSYTLPDIKPILTFNSNAQDTDVVAVLIAVAVDSLDNAGISYIEIYQDDILLEKKECNAAKTCVFSKTVIANNPVQHTYYSKTLDLGGNLVQSSSISINFKGIQDEIRFPVIFSGADAHMGAIGGYFYWLVRPITTYAYNYTESNNVSYVEIPKNRMLKFSPKVLSIDNAETYIWRLNDVIASNDKNFSYNFTDVGDYNVTFEVSNAISGYSKSWIFSVREPTIQGIISDENGNAVANALISFVSSSIFNPETNATNAADTYDQLQQKSVSDSLTDINGNYNAIIPDGIYHIVVTGSDEKDFDIQVNKSAGKANHDVEVNENISVTNFNAEGHIVHSGKYSDSNNYTCGDFVYFTMFGVNNGGTDETITFDVQDHTQSGNPNNSPVVYNGSISNATESLTIPAGQKLNKMFKFKVPCSYDGGKYDIHVLWNNETWHKIGNFFVVPDTTLPYVFAWDSLTTYTNQSLRVPCDGENLPQPGTIGYNEQVYYFMMDGYNEPKWGVTVCVDKDIATDGADHDGITDNDKDGCMVNPPRFVGMEDVPYINYSKSGHYTAKIFAFDESGNTNSTYTNITVYATEAEVNATAYNVYHRFYYNEYEQYNYTYWIASQIRNYKISVDRWDINATNIGDEYITPNDGFHGPNGINYTEIAAAEEANFHFPLGQFVKPIYSMTLDEYNYTLTSFCYYIMCDAGQMMDGQPGCHDENFVPQILRCTPYGGPTGLYIDTYGFTCIPKNVTMTSSSTTEFGAGGTWGMGFEKAVMDPNNDPINVHWYLDGVEVTNTLDTNYTYMANDNFTLSLVGNSSLVGTHNVKVMAFDFSGINVSIPNGPSNSHEWEVTITT